MKNLIVLVIIGIGLTVAGFALYPSESDNLETQIKEELEYDKVITIGTIHRDSEKMWKRYQPLADYIAENISDDTVRYKGEARILPTEQLLVNSINDGKIDIFFDSPLIGMKVASQTELEPFLLSWKEGARNYHSVFITTIDSDISFDNLQNKTIIFEDKESTSGYFLPMIHLKRAGYDIDLKSSEDFSFVFSLDDENTPIWILEGRGDVGATSNLDFEDIPTHLKEKLKVIESTETIPRQIVFVNKNLENKEEIKELLLEMNQYPEIQEIILKISKTSQFSEIDGEKDLNQINELLELVQ